MTSKSKFGLGAASLAFLLVAGCGGGGVSSTPAPTPAPSPAPTPAPTSAPTPAPTPTPTPTPASTFLTPEYNRSTGPAQHGAITVWQSGITGQGVTIGIVDSGIDSDSPEFAGRISGSSADVAGSRGLDNADDDHGTNVAMVAAAARDNTGVLGIAWNATILMLRADSPGTCALDDPDVDDDGCKFNDSAITTGIDRAISAGAKVINLSLGGSAPNNALRAALGRAAAAGIVVVVSAGNDGDSTEAGIDPNNPDPFAAGLRAAGNGNVIIAGSVNKDNVFSAFSNRAGSEATWFLSARGERVCCVYENGVLKTTTDSTGTFQYVFSGTSFSAPQIAGAVALLRQAFPNLTAVQVVDLLLRTATDAGASGTDTTYGRGLLNIAAAFAPQGSTSLAGSTVALPTGDNALVGSGAMGDALAKGRLSTVVLDSYQRAYGVELGQTLRGAQVVPKLGNALSLASRHVEIGNDRVSLAFSVDAQGRVAKMPWVGQLRLQRSDAEVSRVLAARVVARLSPDTKVGFAFAQGADGLVAQLQGRSEPAFLIAGSPLDDYGFQRSDEAALAVRHRLGPWGLTVSAETAEAQSGAPVHLAADAALRRQLAPTQRFGLALDRRFGALDAALGASWLAEQHTVLGARLHDAFGPGGADSLFLDAAAGWNLAPGWRLGAAWRQGFTHAQVGGSLASGSNLTSSAWAIDVARLGVFGAHDSLALRHAQPLRVESGGLNLLVPIDYSYETLTPTFGRQTLSLAPTGRERVTELVWRGPLWEGSAMASLFYRTDPGHYAALPDDKGLALTWLRKF